MFLQKRRSSRWMLSQHCAAIFVSKPTVAASSAPGLFFLHEDARLPRCGLHVDLAVRKLREDHQSHTEAHLLRVRFGHNLLGYVHLLLEQRRER